MLCLLIIYLLKINSTSIEKNAKTFYLLTHFLNFEVCIHRYSIWKVDEDKELSKMASVDLKKMFSGKKVSKLCIEPLFSLLKSISSSTDILPCWTCSALQISKITEMNLSANQEKDAMLKKRLKWKVEGSAEDQKMAIRGRAVDLSDLVVELGPMEIRTFKIDFEFDSFLAFGDRWWCDELIELYQCTSSKNKSLVYVGTFTPYHQNLKCSQPLKLRQ